MASPTRSVSLLSLPQELIECILLHLRAGPSLQDLGRVAQVCHRLHRLATPILYCSVWLRHPINGDRFAWTIQHCPALIHLIRELQFHYHCEESEDHGPEDLDGVTSQLFNLEALVIRAKYFEARPSYPNLPPAKELEAVERWEENRLFCQAARPGSQVLPALSSCDLGFDYEINREDVWWNMYLKEAVFYHPGLRRISITGAVFTGFSLNNSKRLAPASRSTQLEELILLNCDIGPEAISEILTYPHALRPHASSLEYLDLDLYFQYDESVDLSDFSALKHLTIHPEMLTEDWKGMEPFGKLLPPSLESITFRDHFGAFPLATIYEKVLSGELPHLRTLTCHTPVPPAKDMTTETCKDGKTFVEAFKELGVQLSAAVVDDPTRMPEYDSCPCECWYYYHRFGGYMDYW
ncbi:hypothetical protein VTN96DRAFT_2630 [Rasamsonia emersonii]